MTAPKAALSQPLVSPLSGSAAGTELVNLPLGNVVECTVSEEGIYDAR